MPAVFLLAAAGAPVGSAVAGGAVAGGAVAGGSTFSRAPVAAAVRPTAAPFDFNRDGFGDLVIASKDGVGAGAVNVLYGGRVGLSAAGSQYWSQNSSGVIGRSDMKDWFGSATASGDFDRDGYADLALGVPFERVGGVARAGGVNVLYGSSTGLSARGNQFFSQSGEVAGASEEGDEFGRALAAGDFDGDGASDLAVGVPGEDVGPVRDAGTVVVLYGRPGQGLSGAGSVALSQASDGVADEPSEEVPLTPEQGDPYFVGDRFGHALAAGDINNDRRAELAVGVPGEVVAGQAAAGAVHLFHGGGGGLTGQGSKFWTQQHLDVPGGAVRNDGFGAAVVFGDFDGDGRDDLAVGALFDTLACRGDHEAPCQAGSVTIVHDPQAPIAPGRVAVISQDTPGVPGAAEPGDAFGGALGAGNLAGTAADDLAVGVARESFGTCSTCFDQGAVMTFPGGPSGLTGMGARMWTQDTRGIPGTVEPSDSFGASVAVANLGRSGYTDLAIGVPDEDLGSACCKERAGMVHVLYGSSAGPTVSGTQVWTQDVPRVLGTAAGGDSFGYSLGIGR